MAENQKGKGLEIIQEGYQPKKDQSPGQVKGGYQPTKGEAKPIVRPPKKK